MDLTALGEYTMFDWFIFLGAAGGAFILISRIFEYVNDKLQLFATKKIKQSKEEEETKAYRKNTNEIVNKLDQAVEVLIKSDTSRIRREIIDQAKHYTALGYIDDNSLKALQDQYSIYKAEGGNGYIPKVMDKLERLPLVEENSEHLGENQ